MVSDRLLATLFAALFASVINTEPDLLLLEENLLRLIMRISRCHALRPPPGREPSPSVKKALARLDGDPASAIRLPELAGLAGINRYKLLRAFVREVGATPHAYLVQRRVYLARQLRIERGEVWLLACGDSYVGAAVLEERRDHLLVYSIAVRPDRTRKGPRQSPSRLRRPACHRGRSRSNSSLYERADGEEHRALSATWLCRDRHPPAPARNPAGRVKCSSIWCAPCRRAPLERLHSTGLGPITALCGR